MEDLVSDLALVVHGHVLEHQLTHDASSLAVDHVAGVLEGLFVFLELVQDSVGVQNVEVSLKILFVVHEMQTHDEEVAGAEHLGAKEELRGPKGTGEVVAVLLSVAVDVHDGLHVLGESCLGHLRVEVDAIRVELVAMLQVIEAKAVELGILLGLIIEGLHLVLKLEEVAFGDAARKGENAEHCHDAFHLFAPSAVGVF